MENIAAVSTPRGRGGIAVIRISGDSPLEVAGKMFRPSGRTAVADFIPNMLYTGHILCDGFTDYGMCVYFRAPRSFTGEDTVEFHCHGGELIAEKVLSRIYSLGVRPAEGGEFTKRAFLNGKTTLSSAEGMADMINAESTASLRAAGQLYGGRTVSAVRGAQDTVKTLLASIAADTDYPEEGVLGDGTLEIAAVLSPVLDRLDLLASSYTRGRCIEKGVRVAICGRPNVGKSTLLNALLGYDRAIVSPEAGTTRDAVDGFAEIDGIRFLFTDTAGLRDSPGGIEAKGIEIAKQAISSADIVMYVTDGEAGPDDVPEGTEGRLIRVFNKADLRRAPAGYDCEVSALTGCGLDMLRGKLAEAVPPVRTDDGAVICEERHRDALVRACDALRRAISSCGTYPADVIALDITEAWEALGEITGETANEEIIDEVFSKFCVGK